MTNSSQNKKAIFITEPIQPRRLKRLHFEELETAHRESITIPDEMRHASSIQRVSFYTDENEKIMLGRHHRHSLDAKNIKSMKTSIHERFVKSANDSPHTYSPRRGSIIAV